MSCSRISLLIFILLEFFPNKVFPVTTNYPLRVLSKMRLDTSYMKVIRDMRRLEAKMSHEDMQLIAKIGLIQGTMEVEKAMEKHLTEMVADLLLNLDLSNIKETMPKIEKIEKTIERDYFAVSILGNALDLARKHITMSEFRMDMRKISDEVRKYHRRQVEKSKEINSSDLRARLNALKAEIMEHVEKIRKIVQTKTNETIKFLEEKQALRVPPIPYKRTPRKIKNKDSVAGGTNSTGANPTKDSISEAATTTEVMKPVSENTSEEDLWKPSTAPLDPLLFNSNDTVLKSILTDTIEDNLIEETRREDISSVEIVDEDDSKKAEEQREEDFSEEADRQPSGPGGLVGLLAGLSGGEEGSDVGALFGALTGVVMNLFGPNGLDVPSLLSSGSSLLAGLLSGGRNFGIVLGEYVGTVVEGLSGGGGAIENGKFFGNFLGTVLAQLSADPEDEDEPPKPLIFVQNFVKSLFRAKGKSGMTEEDENAENGNDKPMMSDSFGFITHVVRTIVGGATSFILNASLGASGGSSQSSSTAFTGSSSHSKPH